MAFVYFYDADKVVHKVPSELTRFEPNDEADPRVMDKLTVTRASGTVVEVKVDKSYFKVWRAFRDETSPTFRTNAVVLDIYFGDFVRFIGSNRAAPVVLNYWMYAWEGNLDNIIREAMFVTRLFTFGKGSIVVSYSAKSMVLTGSTSVRTRNSKPFYECDDQETYVKTMLLIVDVCEHTRDMIDYVRTSTNELYAKRLGGFLVQTDKLLADVNPTKYLFAMRWLMNDFEKIPRRIRDGWLAAE